MPSPFPVLHLKKMLPPLREKHCPHNFCSAQLPHFQHPLLQFNSQSRDRCSGHGFLMVSMVSVSTRISDMFG
jgi:hypothetical protein